MKINAKRAEKASKGGVEYKEGIYKVRVIEAEEGTSNNGNDFLAVTFETLEGNIFKVKNRYFVTDKSMSILLNFLSAVGLYTKGADVDFEPEDLLGLILELELVKGEANEQGRSYLEVKPWSCKAVDTAKLGKKKAVVGEDGEEEPF